MKTRELESLSAFADCIGQALQDLHADRPIWSAWASAGAVYWANFEWWVNYDFEALSHDPQATQSGQAPIGPTNSQAGREGTF
jgi:hypothetical protein